MSIRPDPQTLITALTQARLSGQPLRAADWASAVHSEAEAYAVQDGVAAALGWPIQSCAIGPCGHQPSR